jgi:hypothetical protein
LRSSTATKSKIGGLDCKSEEQAKKVAKDIARQIALDVGDASARNVVVVDDDSTELFKTPVQP